MSSRLIAPLPSLRDRRYPGSAGSLFALFPVAPRYTRRCADLTLNVCGMTSRLFTLVGRSIEYRLNDGPWTPIAFRGPRAHPRHFRIELSPHLLHQGVNHLEIKANVSFLEGQHVRLPLHYDPSAITLPLHVDWQDAVLEIDDGWWEATEADGAYRVRPRPDEEGYDRILLASGTFPGGRRVRTDVTFRHGRAYANYGFGILPLWGGRPDTSGFLPRQGWSYAEAWFLSSMHGVVNAFSYKDGTGPRRFVKQVRDYEIHPDGRYRILAECWPEVDEEGRHLRYRQRIKWWNAEAPEPPFWLSDTHDEGHLLPPTEYAVALIAYWSQVEFGPVDIEPLDTQVVS